MRCLATCLGLVLAATAFIPPSFAQDEAEFPFDMLAEGINVVSTARDADKVREFYGECLGLKEISPLQIPGSGPMIRFMGGVSELKFIVIDKNLPSIAGAPEDRTGIRSLTVFVNDGEAVVKRLKSKGYDTTRFFDREGALLGSGTVPDGDGNAIDVVFLPDRIDGATYRRIRINLTVGSMADSREFYGKVLGLEEKRSTSSGGENMKYMFQAGPTSIRLMGAIDKPSEPIFHGDAFGMHYIQFIVRNVDELFAELVESGATVGRDPFDLGSMARIAMVRDPDGTVIELAGPKIP